MTDKCLAQRRRLSEAIFWRIQLDEYGQDALAGMHAWIADSASNRAAWLHIQRIWSLFDKSSPELAVLKLRQVSPDRLNCMPRPQNPELFEDS